MRVTLAAGTGLLLYIYATIHPGPLPLVLHFSRTSLQKKRPKNLLTHSTRRAPLSYITSLSLSKPPKQDPPTHHTMRFHTPHLGHLNLLMLCTITCLFFFATMVAADCHAPGDKCTDTDNQNTGSIRCNCNNKASRVCICVCRARSLPRPPFPPWGSQPIIEKLSPQKSSDFFQSHQKQERGTKSKSHSLLI